MLQNPLRRVCNATDDWTNITGDPIVNYMCILAENRLTIFLEAQNSGANRHTAVWLAADAQRVIASLTSSVCGLITDNTSTNKAAWKLLQQGNPSKFFYGCAAHAIHLFVKQFPLVHSNGEVVRFPFEDLTTFAEGAKNIVLFFRRHHAVKHQLEHYMTEMEVNKLVLPGDTRWCSLCAMLKSLQAADEPLGRIINHRRFIAGITGAALTGITSTRSTILIKRTATVSRSSS